MQSKDIEVSEPWADRIFDGSKKIEVRKNNPANWGATKVGDILNVIHKQSGETNSFRVVATRTYSDLNECLSAEGIRHLLPGVVTMSEARRIYLGFDGEDFDSMQEREWEYEMSGCIAIELVPFK